MCIDRYKHDKRKVHKKTSHVGQLSSIKINQKISRTCKNTDASSISASPSLFRFPSTLGHRFPIFSSDGREDLSLHYLSTPIYISPHIPIVPLLISHTSSDPSREKLPKRSRDN